MTERYPYSHDGPPVHGSKLEDFLISEYNRREDREQTRDCPILATPPRMFMQRSA